MTKSYKKIKTLGITTLLIILTYLAYVKISNFFAVDSCLDKGGAWNYEKNYCEFAEQKIASKETNKFDNALTFINAYNENINKENHATGIIEWVNANSLTTKNFKTELKKIIDDAYRQDLELGLDADPILDAQDNPNKGFELESFDKKTNYISVRGKDWPEFKLTMKITEENGNWLVDGCGMINIPKNKRAER